MVTEWEKLKAVTQQGLNGKGTIYIQDLRPGVCQSLKISSQRHGQSQLSARLGGTISTAMTSWKHAERRWQ